MTETQTRIDTFTDELFTGSPVPASRLATSAGVSLADILDAVTQGIVRASLRTIGRGGVTLRGPARLHIAPLWSKP